MSDDAHVEDLEDADDWIVKTGRDKLEQGRQQIQRAEAMVTQAGPTPEAEADARAAFDVLRSAMNWLEDEDSALFEDAHQALDAAGAFTRRTFGCWLHQEGTSYEQRCPVALAHNRVGMSLAAIIEKSECTVCHLAPEDCSHIAGRVYDGVFCARLITEGRLLEISFVGRPAQPDARIERISVPVADLQQALGPRWVPRMDVSCDRCLSPCPGVSRPWG